MNGEQQEIVRGVAGLSVPADQLEERLAQARRQVDQLTPIRPRRMLNIKDWRL